MTRRSVLWTLGLCACLGSPAAAQPIVIDDFSTNQAALALTFPPAGTSASSTVAGTMLGGERDLLISLTSGVIAGNGLSATVSTGFYSYSQDATIAGSGRVEWDGADGNATSLDPTGLGGVDLTAGGTQNAFLVRLLSDDLPLPLVLDVHTDGANASTRSLALPGLIFASTDYVIPYSAFSVLSGAGASFNNVGALTLTVGSPVTAPDLVIDLVSTISTLTAPKTVAVVVDADGDNATSPGDTLEYTIVLSNPADAFGAAEAGVVFTNPINPNSTLVVGSVTTTQGTVTTGNTAGDTSVAVNVGSIADAASVTITFRARIDNPLPAGVTVIPCQGTVTSPSLTLPTDDPATPAPNDPTVIAVVQPALVAQKSSALTGDVNGDGVINPGDTLTYTVTMNNTGTGSAVGTIFNDTPGVNTTLVAGSVVTSQGTVATGNTAGDAAVQVNVGTVAAAGTVTITFRARINQPFPAGVTTVQNQGAVTGGNFPPQVTDAPSTPTPGDPTPDVVVVPIVPPAVPALGEWEMAGLALLLGSLGLLYLRRQRRG
jgi:uncharacterized repeat protein (TIGR01451 family)